MVKVRGDMSARHKRPLAVFWILAVVAAVVMTSGLRQGVTRVFVAAAMPTPLLDTLSPAFMLVEPAQPAAAADPGEGSAPEPGTGPAAEPGPQGTEPAEASSGPTAAAAVLESLLEEVRAVAKDGPRDASTQTRPGKGPRADRPKHDPPGQVKAKGEPARGHGHDGPDRPRGHAYGHLRVNGPRAAQHHPRKGPKKAHPHRHHRPGKARGRH